MKFSDITSKIRILLVSDIVNTLNNNNNKEFIYKLMIYLSKNFAPLAPILRNRSDKHIFQATGRMALCVLHKKVTIRF